MEKLKPLEVELRRLEDLSESIVNDFAYMKKREEEMRDTNGKNSCIPFPPRGQEMSELSSHQVFVIGAEFGVQSAAVPNYFIPYLETSKDCWSWEVGGNIQLVLDLSSLVVGSFFLHLLVPNVCSCSSPMLLLSD